MGSGLKLCQEKEIKGMRWGRHERSREILNLISYHAYRPHLVQDGTQEIALISPLNLKEAQPSC